MTLLRPASVRTFPLPPRVTRPVAVLATLRVTLLVTLAGSSLSACSSDPTSRAHAGREAGAPDAPGDGGVDGPPLLVALSVSSSSPGGASSPIVLTPAFASDVHDYYVRCAAGANALTVSMTASPGSESALVAPTKSPAHVTQTLALSVKENEAIVAQARRGTATSSYWVRCLPYDFPVLGWTPHPEAGTPTPGYYLVGDFLPPAELGGYAMVLDHEGVPVWYFRAKVGGVGDVDNVVRGAVSFVAYATASEPPFEIHSLEPRSTKYVTPTGKVLDGHELQTVPDGGFVVISNPIETNVDLTGLSLPLADGTSEPLGPGADILGCNIVELDGTTGAVRWEWVGSDHFDAAKDSTFPNVASLGSPPTDGGVVIDPFHCNSVDVDPANGDLLVSARNLDSIFYVERATGTILWKMGGVAFTKDHAAYVPVSDPFFRQHDARLLPGWSTACGGRGQISMFDDESSLPGPARAVVYDVTVGGANAGDCGAGGSSGAATVAWQYKGTAMSLATGSFRIAADGSRVIDWGLYAPSVVFTEVDAVGHDLLDFAFADGNFSYRAIKVPLNALDLEAMRETAGVP